MKNSSLIFAVFFTLLLSLMANDMSQCQEQPKTNPHKVHYLKKDSVSGKIELLQSPTQEAKKGAGYKINKLQINKELQKLKKISEQHNIYERIYKKQRQAEKEPFLKKEAKAFKLEQIKIFGRNTSFYKAPFVSVPPKYSSFNKPQISNVLINGKPNDTILIHDSYSLTFSFAPNFISAIVNIYLDIDKNGIIDPDDILLSNGLVLDNSEFDEDLTDGSYRVTFTGTSIYSVIKSSLIFEVNDYRSISQAEVTINQKPSDRVILGTISPPLKNMFVFADVSYDGIFAITDSLGKFMLNIEPEQTQASFYLFDVAGVSNGYLIPDTKTVDITEDTTEVSIKLSPATAFIEGYVKDQDGNPINQVIIQASYRDSKITKTDSTGYYKLGVTTGEYYLDLSNVSSEYMQNKNSRSVTITGNNSTVRCNITLIKTNTSISGEVKYNSNGVGGIPIIVYGDSLINFILSSADGSFTMPVYKPNFDATFYNALISVPYGYYVRVPYIPGIQPGATNVNFEIQKIAGGIQGRITDSRTNKPIANAYIYTYGNDYRNTYSNDSGYYRITLFPGDYYLNVTADYYYQFSTDFSISASMITKNVSLNKSGSFSGSLKDEEGNPIIDANILVIDTSGYPVAYGYSDENAEYQVSGLITSKYGAYVTANGYVSQWYNQVYDFEDATFFQVNEGYDTPNINFVLSKGGSISGKVVDKLGNPISEAWVDVYDTLFNEKSYTLTNNSGYYSATGLAAGSYYVRASGSEYLEEWYKSSTSVNEASLINVAFNENITDINFILTLGSTISGTVKNRANVGLKYVNILVFDSTFALINYAYTNDSGYYFVKPLPAKNKLFILAQNYNYSSQWYDKASTADSATPIILMQEENRENVDFVLSNAAVIIGRVLNISGNPVRDALITLEKDDGSYIFYSYSDYQGIYLIPGVPKGDYYASAEDYSYEKQWYYHKTSKNEADLITVTPDDTAKEINFDLVKINQGDNDSLIITLELANIPDTLNFSQSFVSDYFWEYMWGVRFNADGINSTGDNGCELEICLLHYKEAGEQPFLAGIIGGTITQVIKWEDYSGNIIYSDFPVRIDETNKNTLVMSLPANWNEIKNINENTNYIAETYYYASDGIFWDITNSSTGGNTITDSKGDVKYNFIDIVSTSWQIKKLVDVKEDNLIPKHFSLLQNYPNPFNPSTTISFDLPVRSKVQLKIFNILGEEVKSLINEEKDIGHYSFKWDASGLSSGIYIYRLAAGTFVSSKKLILLK